MGGYHESLQVSNVCKEKIDYHGDFNEILSGSEHSEFENNMRVSTGMREFQEVTSFCRFTDMGYHGPLFTWCNKREKGLICKKLDIVLINEVWFHNSKAYSVFEWGGMF